jgi:hypothetical protein
MLSGSKRIHELSPAQRDCRSIASRMDYARQRDGGSRRQDVPLGKSWLYSAIRHSPKQNAIRATLINCSLPVPPSQSSKDEVRTEPPKPILLVWVKSPKVKGNQSEQKGLALPRGLEPLFSP